MRDPPLFFWPAPFASFCFGFGSPGASWRVLVMIITAACQKRSAWGARRFGIRERRRAYVSDWEPYLLAGFVSGSYHVASVTGRALVCGIYLVSLSLVFAACGGFLRKRSVVDLSWSYGVEMVTL